MEDANAFPRISDSSNDQSSHMDATSRCPPGISTLNDLNLEAAIALASFADATVSSVPSEPKDIIKLEKARHRNVLYRRRMHFEKQITKMNGVNKFSKKEILVWCGTINNGVWRKATQLSCVGEVAEFGRVGKRGTSFEGAIVKYHGEPPRSYEAIKQSFIRREHPPLCWAKQASHHTAKGTTAYQLTGTCFDGRYIRVLWETREEQWLSYGQVEQIKNKGRRVNPVQRYGSDADPTTKRVIPHPVSTAQIEVFYNITLQILVEKKTCSISEAVNLAVLKCGDWKKGGSTKLGRNVFVNEEISSLTELSLIFGVLQGNLPLFSISKEVDDGLCVNLKAVISNKDCNVYINAICVSVGNSCQENRGSTLSTNWIKRQRKCANPGCSTLAHLTDGKHCLNHSVKPKRLCTLCNVRIAKRRGCTCDRCFKAHNIEFGHNEKCSGCKVRKPRNVGGMCASCLN